jgi:hypothetical protein
MTIPASKSLSLYGIAKFQKNSVLTIGRRHKVGIVETTAVLSIGDHGIVLLATTTKVVLLEVARNFVKTVSFVGAKQSTQTAKKKGGDELPIVEVVHHIGNIKKLSNARVDVFPSFVDSIAPVGDLRLILEIKHPVLSTFRPVVVHPIECTFPILMCKYLNKKKPG